MATYPAWHERGYGLILRNPRGPDHRRVFADPARYLMGYLVLQPPEEKEMNLARLADEHPTETNLEERIRKRMVRSRGEDILNYGWTNGVLQGTKWYDRGHTAQVLTKDHDAKDKGETRVILRRAAQEGIAHFPENTYSSEGDYFGGKFKYADVITAGLAALDIALHLDERSPLSAEHNRTGLTHTQRQPYKPTSRLREAIPFNYFEHEHTDAIMRHFMYLRFGQNKPYTPIDREVLSAQLIRDGVALSPYVEQKLMDGRIVFGPLPHRRQEINEAKLTERQRDHVGTIRQANRDIRRFLLQDGFNPTGEYAHMYPDTHFQTVGNTFYKKRGGKEELVVVGTPLAHVRGKQLIALPPMLVHHELHDFSSEWEDSADPLPLIHPFAREPVRHETTEDSTRRTATTTYMLPTHGRRMRGALSSRARDIYRRGSAFFNPESAQLKLF